MVRQSVVLLSVLIFVCAAQFIAYTKVPQNVNGPNGEKIHTPTLFAIFGALNAAVVFGLGYFWSKKALYLEFRHIPWPEFWCEGLHAERKVRALEVAVSRTTHEACVTMCIMIALNHAAFATVRSCKNGCSDYPRREFIGSIILFVAAVLYWRWSVTAFYAAFSQPNLADTDEFTAVVEASRHQHAWLNDVYFCNFEHWYRGVFYYSKEDSRVWIPERFRGTGIVPFCGTFNLAQAKGKLGAAAVGMLLLGLVLGAMLAVVFQD